MNISTRMTAAVAAAIGMTGMSAATAGAEAANGVMVPLTAFYRSCDFTVLQFVAATGFGSGQSTIHSSGNSVTAQVNFAIGTPNTAYQVRLIQGPRPGTQKCIAGDPGVASAVLHTDRNGTGSVTVTDTIEPWAKNAWVFMEGPPDPGQIRGEFYTSEILTAIN
ncbi:hypothetical protein [Mycolicibacterium agri]|uniref:Secreted protein n=2 Tax=Mycolicibacterium agri TaxID=36811 RepID=A0A7I9W5W9_MYCAG|nr:hypothetical protein [Mycolicibacterium agri]GFG53073.1 hypothetical protein MAGR_45140 [Mycolicibacterium agri]